MCTVIQHSCKCALTINVTVKLIHINRMTIKNYDNKASRTLQINVLQKDESEINHTQLGLMISK